LAKAIEECKRLWCEAEPLPVPEGAMSKSVRSKLLLFSILAILSTAAFGQAERKQIDGPRASGQTAEVINLPTSKQLIEPVPGDPQRINSLPMTIAASSDGRYMAVVNAGYGTFESKYQQSIAILDTTTGKVTDFPEARTAPGMPQTLFSGLAFSPDCTHVYAAFDSLTAPEGNQKDATGNAIAVYSFKDGSLGPEKLLPVPPQRLAPGRAQNRIGASLPEGTANPSPAGIAVRKGTHGDELVIADNLSDDVLLMDGATGEILKRFDLAEGKVVPSTYPVAVTLDKAGSRAFVALWNGSAVAELDLDQGKVLQKLDLLPPRVQTSPSSHPAALTWDPDGKTLYVALANRDAVAAVRVEKDAMRLQATYDTRLPGQSYFGAMPDAVAVSADGRHLFAANTGSDAIAVFDLHGSNEKGRGIAASGFLPTEWYPTALAMSGNKLYVATDKGRGTGPNNLPQRIVPGQAGRHSGFTYIGTLIYGSIAAIDWSESQKDLKHLTDTVIETNRMKAAQPKIAFQSGSNPIKHIIYIIKENRSYDQVLGDLGVGNGDRSLTMYGEDITPNEHKLARQFGVLDNFYDSGEVSGDGHVWSNAAITSDYTEKTWQQSYRGRERAYDYEGVVENGYPLIEGIPDTNEPASGYLWTNLTRYHKSLYHFAEFISTEFCNEPSLVGQQRLSRQASPIEGTPEPAPAQCGAQGAIHKGDPIPANYGGGESAYPWPIPLIRRNVATKPELVGHFDPLYPDFNLSFPDQLRVEEFLVHFRSWVEDREKGDDTMPQFIQLRLPNDHTAGTRPGMPTPRASVADNDLAVGRAVEAISHSPYWNDTAFFILEDDAQNGPDHVEAHRSIAFVVSKYAPKKDQPVVDSDFYTTVSVIRTMEELLGVPPMNNNDAFAPPIASLFSGAGDQAAYEADYRNRDNGLIYQANAPSAPGARQSSKMDFRHEDRADPRILNVILWRDAMGDKPLPFMLAHPPAPVKDRDGDGF
jgi:DNA-binding beta-propeller fold protein YncE